MLDAFSEEADTRTVAAGEIPDGWQGLDIGEAAPGTVCPAEIQERRHCRLEPDPWAYFEMKKFAAGTEAVAKALAESDAITIIGGGDDRAAAAAQLGYADRHQPYLHRRWCVAGVPGGSGAAGYRLPGRQVSAGGQHANREKRTPVIAGNWKMNSGSPAEASVLLGGLLEACPKAPACEVVVCPPATALALAAESPPGQRHCPGRPEKLPALPRPVPIPARYLPPCSPESAPPMPSSDIPSAGSTSARPTKPPESVWRQR